MDVAINDVCCIDLFCHDEGISNQMVSRAVLIILHDSCCTTDLVSVCGRCLEARHLESIHHLRILNYQSTKHVQLGYYLTNNPLAPKFIH